jgi:beta-N-acetylhexosaminidase
MQIDAVGGWDYDRDMKPDRMTDEMLCGQRLMLGFDGTRLDSDLVDLIRHCRPGGLILFRRNVTSPEQLTDLCAAAQGVARDIGLPPLVISIDQEGGQVARLSAPFTVFAGNPAMRDTAEATAFGETCGRELLACGVNMNLAPVLDVAPPGFDSIMAQRIFARDPARVAEMGCTVIRSLQDCGVMAVGKHFPGIGRTRVDSHHELPFFEEDLASLDAFDLLPFRAAIEASVAGIMLSHIFYRKLDARWPASLSRFIACTMLREKMGYIGVVMTDDLDMGAIRDNYSLGTCIDRILAADIDMVLICHRSPKQEKAFALLQERIREDVMLHSRAVESAHRILALKESYLPPEGDTD